MRTFSLIMTNFFLSTNFYVSFFVQVTHCGRIIELIPGGSRVPVTPDRVHEYVQLSVTTIYFLV